MKWFPVGLLLAVVIGVSIVGAVQVQAQVNSPAAPADLVSVNGPNPGEVILNWTAIPGVSAYRIGWMADEDYRAYPDTWRGKFAYSDVTADFSYTLTRLTPGIKYWLIAGRQHDGGHVWPQRWVSVTLNDDETDCPSAGTPTEPIPTPTLQPTPRPTPAPTTAGDYDSDDDGLIEVSNLAQLNAIRHDSDGDGYVSTDVIDDYFSAFSGAADDMGCPIDGCIGYELVNDLDFDTNGSGEADEGDAYWNGGGWDPIYLGRDTTFEGGNYVISNLYIHRSDEGDVGLFSTNDGVIRNVRLTNVNVSGEYRVGGLAGNLQSGSISGSHVSGSVTGEGAVGGVVGYSQGRPITAVHADVNVVGKNNIGGLVGYNSVASREDEVISDSTAIGAVVGEDNVGGLVGKNVGSLETASLEGTLSAAIMWGA